MARMKEAIDQLTRQLITNISGFEEEDENFGLCLQFAQSNFRYHRFLDVDSHRVNRQIEGLLTKLQVHSLGPRANTLKDLVQQFLHSPIADGQESTQTDTHYAVLSVLVLLAGSPTNTEYVPPTPPDVPEPEEQFDWAGHLLEGETTFAVQYSDTSSEEEELPRSDESDEDVDDDDINPEENDTTSTTEEERHKTQSLIRGGEGVSMETTLDQDRGEEWLNQNVMAQYWRGQGQSQGQVGVRGEHAASNLLRDWTSYQVRSGEVYAAVDQHVITEYQLIREILWMLSGIEELFVFSFNDSGFHLKEDVRLSHLTGPSLEKCLGHLTSLANQIHSLQAFVDDVVGASCHSDLAHKSPLGSQTFQAFAASLAGVLTDFRAHLSGLERELAEQDKSDCVTVSSLVDKLSPWTPTLQVLWEIFTAGILQEPEPPDADGDPHVRKCNSSRVSRLLTALYDGVVTQDSLGQCSTYMVSVLLRLLLETSRPYLEMIGGWISAGHLSDPANEFVLQRNASIQCLDETFWERALTLNTSPHTHTRTTPHNTSSTSSLSSAGMCAEEEEGEGGRAFREAVEATPKFLRAVMRDVVLTGKSMELLQALGRLPEVLQSVREGELADKSLYQLFVDSLKEVLGTLPSTTKEYQRETSVTAQLFMQHLKTENRVTGSQDWLLEINFQAIFSSVFTEKLKVQDPYDLKHLGHVEDSYVSPISLLFERCLYPHIHHRYNHVCSRLLHILKAEYKLMDFLHSMQHFYLMSAGDAMFDFYTQIFDKMRQQELWREASSLTLALQEALQSHHAQHVSRLSITMETMSKTRERSAVNATDCLRLHFAVPWPVDVVVNSKCLNLYNQMFRFLLQIKRAKYGLDQLRFSGLDKTSLQTVSSLNDSGSRPEETVSRSERLHRLHVLRFRLAYFVNSLHNYIMTRILFSTGLEFADEIKRARDLEQVIEIHGRYVRTIHERCLLHKKLAFLKDAVTKVLNLTLAFAMRWDQGVHNISGQSLSDMEVEFSRCIQFLASFLNNIIKRGSFPHVEPLAFALVTSLPSGTKF